MSIVKLFEEADKVLSQWQSLVKERETALRAAHPQPREAREWSDPMSAEDRKLYSKEHAAVHEYFMKVIRLARDTPEANALMNARNALVSKGLEKIRGWESGRYDGKGPGLCPCAVCGSPCVSIPQVITDRDRSANTMYGLCVATESHVMKWLPWGG